MIMFIPIFFHRDIDRYRNRDRDRDRDRSKSILLITLNIQYWLFITPYSRTATFQNVPERSKIKKKISIIFFNYNHLIYIKLIIEND